MTAKKWLQRGWKINQRINRLIKQKSDIDKNVGMDFVSYDTFENHINKNIDRLYKIKNEIMSAIDKVEDYRLHDLLVNRYINFYIWEKIAEDMDYSVVHIYRLHGKALKEFQNVMECYVDIDV